MNRDQSIRLNRIEEALQSTRHQFIFQSPAQCAYEVTTLKELLPLLLPHLQSDSWNLRFELGAVFKNGLVASPDEPVSFPIRIEYFEPRQDAQLKFLDIPRFDPSWIVFEDAWISVCFKPFHLACLPAREQRFFNLKTYLEDHYKTSIHMPSRLDMSTQGLCVISRTQEAHKPLQQLFELRQIKKLYLFVSHNRSRWNSLTLNAPIGKDPLHPILRKIDGESSKSAITTFSKLSDTTNSDNCVYAALPRTGRTHQIRVHAHYLHIPLLGDNFYEGKEDPNGLHLLSAAVEFMHPITKNPILISLPKAFLPSWLPDQFHGILPSEISLL